jgi:eukaryotic-like serine/threonine-protein kinase
VAEPSPRITAEEISIDVIETSLRDLLTTGDIAESDPKARSALASVGPISPDPLVGAVVADRYRVVELLGRGGMGAVYEVEHTRIGKLLAMKLLAMKLLAHELSGSADAARRFKREALTVSKLQSPNTVSVLDFGVSAGLTYFVMELVGGVDLSRELRALGPMPFARAARVVVLVCSSLWEARSREPRRRARAQEGSARALSANRGSPIRAGGRAQER